MSLLAVFVGVQLGENNIHPQIQNKLSDYKDWKSLL